ncbi:DEAD/DEAH box helicase family protein [Aquimarina spinulae]|uniref:DEAD/DEAH box helicase family protein n=1 Tax=Aquimarina spinulae TaxID=1192023 RepID=UPI000D560299|nr:DEAD/DEAH box helicase family protein [Aquimarina spinulae]
MNELELQEKYIIHFLTQRQDGLQYKEVKPNTVSPKFFIVEDLLHIISQTPDNKKIYPKLLKQFTSEDELIESFMDFLNERIVKEKNMAIFLNNSRTVTFKGVKLRLFYESNSILHGDERFEENIFSVVQELPYAYKEGKSRFAFRPDLTFFVNGMYLGYSEIKSTYNNQNAKKEGRNKVAKDYYNAVLKYLDIAGDNDVNESIRRSFLKVFEKAIHITATDVNDTYIVRTINEYFESIKDTVDERFYDFDKFKETLFKRSFQAVPYDKTIVDYPRQIRFEDIMRAVYGKKMIEKEILYYNFLEREYVKDSKSNKKVYKHNDGKLIAPRPKQKFGTDKILSKIDEFLDNESDPNYLENKLKKELETKGFGKERIEELIEQREKYLNNKNVYSLLLQYAAGFGKSNIIGWTALQLKDLRKNGKHIYDKIMLVVDRVQLRDQLDTKMLNMNISNTMFIEADNQKKFIKALNSKVRIVVVNLQKFNSIREALDKSNPEITKKLSKMRIAFLIDEIHRSHSNTQHEEMNNLFAEIQTSFDQNKEYLKNRTKKNLIIGFTATPSEHSLARFGEFDKFAESEKIWTPFDNYTMREAITDGFILNPLPGRVAVSAKMYFDLPDNELEGFEDEDRLYRAIPDNIETGIDIDGKKYKIRKKEIYENERRINAISKFIVKTLVSVTYHTIKGKDGKGWGKAMLAVSSIKAAQRYKVAIDKFYEEITQEHKYERFKEAPVYLVYSDSQKHQNASTFNEGITEKKVLERFSVKKNGLIIVVDKLQTGFDEPKLHTLFLDKEIRGINAIQTISRVNRKTKNKHDCKIVDFSYKNVNIENIDKAYSKFSNVVDSEFSPLEDEKRLLEYYKELKDSTVYKQVFSIFSSYYKVEKNIDLILQVQDYFIQYIKDNAQGAKYLKIKVSKYFKTLNVIENIIDFDPILNDSVFKDFWNKFNSEYNNLNFTGEIIDDVEIYFDNRIGIVISKEYEEKLNGKPSIVSEPSEDYGGGNNYKYDILKVIEKRNQEEEAIEELILDVQEKIDGFFNFVKNDKLGKRLIAKILDETSVFEQEEIYSDFAVLYRMFVRRRKKDLGEDFIKQTKDLTNQLCDDFERNLK